MAFKQHQCHRKVLSQSWGEGADWGDKKDWVIAFTVAYSKTQEKPESIGFLLML